MRRLFVKARKHPHGEDVEVEFNPDGLHLSKDFLFKERAINGESYPISAVSIEDGTFGIEGDHADDFLICDWFIVTGSTGNNNTFLVIASNYDEMTDTTTITTDDVISDDTVDGDIWPSAYRVSFDVPANTFVTNMLFIPLSVWAADNRQEVFSFDESDPPVTYIDSLSLDALAIQSILQPNQVKYYAEANKIWVTALVNSLSPPVVPTGKFILKIEYFTPITAVAATFE